MEAATKRYDKMIITGTLLVIFYLGLAYMWVSDEGCMYRMDIMKNKCQDALNIIAMKCNNKPINFSVFLNSSSNITWWGEYGEKKKKEK